MPARKVTQGAVGVQTPKGKKAVLLLRIGRRKLSRPREVFLTVCGGRPGQIRKDAHPLDCHGCGGKIKPGEVYYWDMHPYHEGSYQVAEGLLSDTGGVKGLAYCIACIEFE